MADVRIKDLPVAISAENEDYVAIDNANSGTRSFNIGSIYVMANQAHAEATNAEQLATAAYDVANSSADDIADLISRVEALEALIPESTN